MFRDFATKDDLIAAISSTGSRRSSGRRKAARRGGSGRRVLEFLRVAAHQRQQRDLSFLQDAGALNAEVTRFRAQLFDT